MPRRNLKEATVEHEGELIHVREMTGRENAQLFSVYGGVEKETKPSDADLVTQFDTMIDAIVRCELAEPGGPQQWSDHAEGVDEWRWASAELVGAVFRAIMDLSGLSQEEDDDAEGKSSAPTESSPADSPSLSAV